MTTVTIEQSEDFLLHFTFRPVEALPGFYAITIETQWLGADDPNGRQVKYATIVKEAEAMRIADGIVTEITLEHVS
jgi:hypothetical protein